VADRTDWFAQREMKVAAGLAANRFDRIGANVCRRWMRRRVDGGNTAYFAPAIALELLKGPNISLGCAVLLVHDVAGDGRRGGGDQSPDVSALKPQVPVGIGMPRALR
jgi:hypothetical protein